MVMAAWYQGGVALYSLHMCALSDMTLGYELRCCQNVKPQTNASRLPQIYISNTPNFKSAVLSLLLGREL